MFIQSMLITYNMLNAYYSLLAGVLACSLAVDNYTLQDCRTSHIDLIIYVPYMDHMYKTRTKWVVSNFFPAPPDDKMNTRVAVFTHQPDDKSPVELVGFHSYQSPLDLVSKVDFTHGFNKKEESCLHLVHTSLIEYFDKHQSKNKSETKVIINFNGTNRKKMTFTENKEVFYFYIELDTEMYLSDPEIDASDFFWTDRTFRISQANEVVNYNIISVSLCGQCSPGWAYFKSKAYSGIHSCYKLEVSQSLLSYSDATVQCEDLKVKAKIVALETAEEIEFLQENVPRLILENPEQLNLTSAMIHIGLCEYSFRKRRDKTQNGQIFTVGTHTSKIPCAVWKIKVNKSSSFEQQNVSWVIVDHTLKITNLYLCELEIKHNVTITDHVHTNKVLPLNPRSLSSQSEDTFRLFRCSQYETEVSDLIPYSNVCDNYRQCPNNRDERMCSPTLKDICKTGFPCGNSGKCVLESLRCDGISDCPDNSDEENCSGCMETTCTDGTCLPNLWFYNHTHYTNLYSRQEKMFQCNIQEFTDCKDDVCFSVNDRRKAIQKCQERKELYIDDNTVGLDVQSYKWAPRCIYQRSRYTRKTLGCTDLSHLEGCLDFVCMEGLYKCPSSYCIPIFLLNDGYADCPYEEDESNTLVETLGNPELFRKCAEYRNKCIIHLSNICDGHPQCPNGDDERVCFKSCPSGFTCKYGVSAVTDHRHVNLDHLFHTLDPDTKVLHLSGINISQVYLPYHLSFSQLLELHLSQCSLSDEILHKMILRFGSSLHTVYFLDLSFNEINLANSPVFFLMFKNLHILNISFTNIYLFHIPKKFFLNLVSVDLSSTKLKSFRMSGSRYAPFIHLNLSSTDIDTMVWLDDKLTIGTLDIRHTRINFDSKTFLALKNLTINFAIFADNFKLCCDLFSGPGIPSHTCHAPNDAVASCSDLLGDIVKRGLLSSVALCGFVGNIVAISFRFVFEKDKLKRSNILFITNLSISDFLMSVYLAIIAGSDVYYRDNYVLHEEQWRASLLCTFAGFLATLSYETSTLFVLLITLDRYLLFRKPLDPVKIPFKGLMALVVAAWVFGLVLALVPVIQHDWKIYSSNGMCLGLPINMKQDNAWVFSFSVFVVLSFILVLFITAGQIMIFRSISLPTNSIINSSLQRKREITVAQNLSLVVMSSVLCWFPVCVMGLMSAAGHMFSPDTLGWLVVLVLPLNSALNPILYTLPALRQRWKDFMKLHRTLTEINDVTRPEDTVRTG